MGKFPAQLSQTAEDYGESFQHSYRKLPKTKGESFQHSYRKLMKTNVKSFQHSYRKLMKTKGKVSSTVTEN